MVYKLMERSILIVVFFQIFKTSFALTNGKWTAYEASEDNLKLCCISYHGDSAIQSAIVAPVMYTNPQAYVSKDNGDSFDFHTIYVDDTMIPTAVCSVTNVMYSSFDKNGIFVSQDYGSTWVSMSSEAGTKWNSIACAEDLSGTMYATGLGYGLCKGSTDKTRCDKVHIEVDAGGNTPYTSVCISDDATYVSVAAADGHIYISPNSGSSWIVLTLTAPTFDTSLSATSVYTFSAIDCSSDGKTIVIVSNSGMGDAGGVFLATDGGNDFHSILGVGKYTSVSCNDDCSTILVAVNGGDVYMTTDSGNTWSTTTSSTVTLTNSQSISYNSKTNTFVFVPAVGSIYYLNAGSYHADDDVPSPSATTSIAPSAIKTVVPSKVPTAVPSLKTTAPSSRVPSKVPSKAPVTKAPVTKVPSNIPSVVPSEVPLVETEVPSAVPSIVPTSVSTTKPSLQPVTDTPSAVPSTVPSEQPIAGTENPTITPSVQPSEAPVLDSVRPSVEPSAVPSEVTIVPSATPSAVPSASPSDALTATPSVTPSAEPVTESAPPTIVPSLAPTIVETDTPSAVPSETFKPTPDPSIVPSAAATTATPTATVSPSITPTISEAPTHNITNIPTLTPTINVTWPTMSPTGYVPPILPQSIATSEQITTVVTTVGSFLLLLICFMVVYVRMSYTDYLSNTKKWYNHVAEISFKIFNILISITAFASSFLLQGSLQGQSVVCILLGLSRAALFCGWLCFIVLYVYTQVELHSNQIPLFMLLHKPAQKGFRLIVFSSLTFVSLFDPRLLSLLPWERTKFTEIADGYPTLQLLKICLYSAFCGSILQCIGSILLIMDKNNDTDMFRNDANKELFHVVFVIISVVNTIWSFVWMLFFIQLVVSEDLELALIDVKRLSQMGYDKWKEDDDDKEAFLLDENVSENYQTDADFVDLECDRNTLAFVPPQEILAGDYYSDGDENTVNSSSNGTVEEQEHPVDVEAQTDRGSITFNTRTSSVEVPFAKQTLAMVRQQLMLEGHTPVEYIPLDKLQAEIQTLFAAANSGITYNERRLDYLLACLEHNPQYKAEKALEAIEWRKNTAEYLQECLLLTRSFIPPAIFSTTQATLVQYYHVPLELAKRIMNKKCLWLTRINAVDINKMHIAELRGRFDPMGTDLDIVEMCAIYASLPTKFTNDSEGKKEKWRLGVEVKIRSMITNKKNNSLPKNQLRHPVYNNVKPVFLDVYAMHEMVSTSSEGAFKPRTSFAALGNSSKNSGNDGKNSNINTSSSSAAQQSESEHDSLINRNNNDEHDNNNNNINSGGNSITGGSNNPLQSADMSSVEFQSVAAMPVNNVLNELLQRKRNSVTQSKQ